MTAADRVDPTVIGRWLGRLDGSPGPLSVDAAQHRALAAAARNRGDELGALAHLIAAENLIASDTRGAARNLCEVATGYFMKEDYAAAARWYQLALHLDPDQAIPYLNLAALFADAGLTAEAVACREQAYRRQRLYVEAQAGVRRRVLILFAGHAAGNVPVDILLPTISCGRIKYALDYAPEAEDEALPPYDVVFNAIGDADIAAPLDERLSRFAARCTRPLLNPPAAIRATRRDRIAQLLHGIDGIELAPCLRLDNPPASRAMLTESVAALGWPLLARPAASHGGEGLVRCDSLEALAECLQTAEFPQYLTAYRDYVSADGYYRKYRMIFVDRQPYPYHLAISTHWMVHYQSAGMKANPWKIAEERRFVDDAGSVLGTRALAALAAIGQRLDLDYAGIDFSILADGRLLVFEANATMRVHRVSISGPLAHKNAAVERIVAACQRLLESSTA